MLHSHHSNMGHEGARGGKSQRNKIKNKNKKLIYRYMYMKKRSTNGELRKITQF